MYFVICITVLIFIVIVIFAFPQFSPIPYFPSNGKDIPLILKALHICNDQTIIDLGAGDGVIILKAAEEAYRKKLDTQFIAVEINPILLLIISIRRLFHPNRESIKIVNADMFSMNYSSYISNLQSLTANHYPLTTFYIYISPWYIDKTVANITRQIKNFQLVSYFYQVKCLPKFKEDMKEGVHKILSYH